MGRPTVARFAVATSTIAAKEFAILNPLRRAKNLSSLQELRIRPRYVIRYVIPSLPIANSAHACAIDPAALSIRAKKTSGARPEMSGRIYRLPQESL